MSRPAAVWLSVLLSVGSGGGTDSAHAGRHGMEALWRDAGKGSAGAGDTGAAPDWVLLAGGVVTQDAARPRVEAIAVRAGRIVAVGSRDDIRRLAGVKTRIEELPGATVLPGLADAHGHVLSLGFSLRRVDLKEVPSYDELIERVRRRAAAQPKGTWIVGRGWDQTLWPGGGFPHHAQLSRAVPDHPVFLSRIDGHAALVNARALALAGITAKTPDPEGGRIVRDADGSPGGVLIDNAVSLVQRKMPAPTRAEQVEALSEALVHLASAGLTAVHDAGVGFNPANGLDDPDDPGWATVDLYRALLAEGRLTLRIYAMLGGNGAHPPEERFFAKARVIGEGDGMLTVRAIKLGADGALGSRGAALEQPYADEPGNTGLMTRDGATLARLATRAFETGWQVAIHAIGDRGNRVSLDAIEIARRSVPRASDPRPRIEHAQVLRPEDLPRFAGLGVIASVQPTHATSDMRWAEARLGAGRLAGAYAYGSLSRSGARLACGSDFPVEGADPLQGIQAAVTRQDLSGRPPGGWRPEERLTVGEALACFTTGAAYAAFMEGEVGRIVPGQRADLTAVNGDPTAVDPERIASLKILLTVVGGRIVHDARADAGR